MATFLDDQREARRWAELLADYDRRLQALERSTQARYTSIEGGSLDIYDDEGTLKGSVGVQPDGGVALVPVNTTPPPTPSPPTVEPVLAGLLVGWDGLWDDSYTSPTDFSLVQVHVGPAADFTPDLSTLVATITAPLGGMVTIAIEGYTPVWVRLVGANTAAVTGPASIATQGTPRQAVPQDLIDGIISETKLAAEAVTQAKIALGAVNSIALADGAVLTEKLADNAVKVGKLANGAVTINALGGALSDSAVQRYVDTMGDPAAWQISAQGTGATWDHLTGVADAPTGQNVGEAKGYIRLRGTTLIPYEPGVLYRVSARIRATAQMATGPDQVFVGVLGLGADETTLVNRTGADSPSGHYYVGASGKTIATADGWVTIVGYLKDRAAPGASGSAGPNFDPRAAGLVHESVRFIAPYLWLNYSSSGVIGSPAVMQVDAFTIEALKTGVVDATNLVAGSVTTAALATDAVTAGKVAADAISARELQVNSVTAAELAAGSVTAAAVAAGAITAEKLTIVGSANILPDPSFEGAVTAALIVGLSYATQDKTFGNGSAASLKLDSRSATAAYRDVGLTLLPMLAGDQLYLAVDYYLSADWAGSSINIHARWEDAAGAILGYGVVGTSTPVREAWTRLSATTTAPAGTVRAAIRVQGALVTAGDVWFDNAAVRPVVPGVQIADGAITAPKILAGAITTDKLFALAVTAEKIAALAITADKLAALSVTADKLAANSVTATKILAGSIEASHIKAGTITADKLGIGVNGNLIPDPSFETGYIEGKLSGRTDATIVTGGNNSGHALRFALDPSATRTFIYDRFPVTTGERYWAAFDFKGSTDFVGAGGIIMALQWLDSAGAHLSFSVISNSGPQPDDTWRREKYIHAAPPSAAYCAPRLQSPTGTGSVSFDNVELRPVLSSAAGGGSRAEISPDGLRLFDAEGEEAVSLVTGRPNYLTLSNDGQAVATIDQSGNAGFSDLAVAGEFTVGGDTIGSLMSDAARGLIAVDYQYSAVTGSNTDFGFVELSFTAETSRMYRVVLDCYADPSAAGGELVLALKDAGAATPTIATPQIQSAIHPMPTDGLRRVRMETIRPFGAGQHRLLTTFRCQGGPSGQTVNLLGGTTYPGVFYVEDVGPYIPDTGQFNTGGGSTTPPVQKYTKTYAASWSGSYANRSGYNSYYGNQMMQGYYSSTNGIQAALVGFPAALGTDLSGATITKAEIYLYFDHWYSNSGGTAVIKAHKHTSRPSTFSCDPESQSVTWARNQGKWVDITAVFDSTTWRGIALDPNSSSSTYYGSARGVGETYPPQLRVTYTK
ncbi:hypothetical protein [Streptomyces sp. NPDC000880]